MTFRALAALPVMRRRLATAAGRALDDVDLDRLAVFALLHDLGKPNRGFQDKILRPDAPRAGHVRELAPLFTEDALCERLAVALEVETLAAWFADPEDCVALLMAAISSHGTPCATNPRRTHGTRQLLGENSVGGNPRRGRDPFAGIAALRAMARWAFPSAFTEGMAVLPATPALQHRFAGLVMLADWLGSHEGFFPFDRDTGDRLTFALEAARRALQAVGLDARADQTALVEHPRSSGGVRFRAATVAAGATDFGVVAGDRGGAAVDPGSGNRLR